MCVCVCVCVCNGLYISSMPAQLDGKVLIGDKHHYAILKESSRSLENDTHLIRVPKLW